MDIGYPPAIEAVREPDIGDTASQVCLPNSWSKKCLTRDVKQSASKIRGRVHLRNTHVCITFIREA